MHIINPYTLLLKLHSPANKPKVLYGLLKEPDLQVTAIEDGDKEEVTDGDDTTPVKKVKPLRE